MEDVKLGKTLKFLSSSLDKCANKKLKEFDLSLRQGVVLVWLNEAEEKTLTLKIIEKRFGAAQSTAFGIINRLESKELIETFISEHRTKVVKITEKGLELIESLKATIDSTDKLFFKGFTEGEKIIFLELLKKAENNFMQEYDIEKGELNEK